MVTILVPVDGSEAAARATRKLIETLGWYKELPRIELLAVNLPVPHFPNMSIVVSKEMLQGYYADECEAMLAPSKKALDAAAVSYTPLTRVGAIAEGIVEQAKRSGSDMIWMGTRGMTALSNMVLGSVATKVLHLAQCPVVLIR